MLVYINKHHQADKLNKIEITIFMNRAVMYLLVFRSIVQWFSTGMPRD